MVCLDSFGKDWPGWHLYILHHLQVECVLSGNYFALGQNLAELAISLCSSAFIGEKKRGGGGGVANTLGMKASARREHTQNGLTYNTIHTHLITARPRMWMLAEFAEDKVT